MELVVPALELTKEPGMTSVTWAATPLAEVPLPDDAEALAALRNRDKAVFSRIYRRIQPALYRFSLAMSGSPTLAEEAVQESFLRLIRNPDGFCPEKGSLQSYLFGIARYTILHLRRESREVALSDENADVPVDRVEPVIDSLARQERIALVQQAILALPPHYREVIVLCDLEELAYEHAAQLLGCPIGTVRSRLNRARAQLKARLLGRSGESL